MKELSLFTGAGGGLLGSKLLGWETVGMVEINEYCQKVLMQRQADGLLDKCPIFGDIRDFIKEGWAASYQGMVDIITGGFPCQDISCAGTGLGLNGERSGLWREMAQIIRVIKPRYVFVENSPMLTVRGLGTVLRDLAAMGLNARWGCISCASIGGPHRRDRIWILAYTPGKRQPQSEKLFRVDAKSQISRTGIWGGERMDKPSIPRVADGMAYQLDRLKAVGNGQVPLVVRRAWEILTQRIEANP